MEHNSRLGGAFLGHNSSGDFSGEGGNSFESDSSYQDAVSLRGLEQEIRQWVLQNCIPGGGWIRLTLEGAPLCIRADPGIALFAISGDPDEMKFVSEDLRENPDFVKLAVAELPRPHTNRHRSGLPLGEIDPSSYQQDAVSLRGLEQEIRQWVLRNFIPEAGRILFALKGAPLCIGADPEIALFSLSDNEKDWEEMIYVSEDLRANADFVKLAVADRGCRLEYASDDLKADREVVTIAVTEYGQALEFASPELRADHGIVSIAVADDGGALEFASPELRDDREIVTIAVTEDGRALEFASPELRTDPEIVTIAITIHGGALEFASPELRDDREIVAIAVTQFGRALEFASPELRDDREIVTIAVFQHGGALGYASAELRDDREIVSIAVAEDCWALAFASTELRDDREIVTIAITQHGRALRLASANLHNDPVLLGEAVRNHYRGDNFQGRQIAGRLCRLQVGLESLHLQAQGGLECLRPNAMFNDEESVGQGAMAFLEYMWQRIYPVALGLFSIKVPGVVRTILEYSDIPSDFSVCQELERLAPVVEAFAEMRVQWRRWPAWLLEERDEDRV